MRSKGEGGRARMHHVSTTKDTTGLRSAVQIEQGKVGFHLFLHKGPPCAESLWRLSLANIFNSNFPSSLLCSSQNMRNVLFKGFPSPMFLLFRFFYPQCNFPPGVSLNPQKHNFFFLLMGYEIICSEEWAE